MSVPGAFSDDYDTARDRFRALAGARGGRLEAQPIGLCGPAGAELTIDAARFGPEDAPGLVVVSSGLHGVEGFFGSAVQVAYLEGGAVRMPEGVGLLLLHALNPYGFAHLRRADERNIDPNRNFLLPGEPYAGSPEHYGALDALLNPPRPPRRFEPFLPRALATIVRYGMPALRGAIAGGQYDYPRGLFFGGHGPSRTRDAIAAHLPRWLGGARHVVHLDLHTGIGPRGVGSLLLEAGLDAARVAWWREHFDAGRVHQDPPSWAYQHRGGFGRWCRATFAGRRYDFATAEFGTEPGIRVVAALRAENQAHHWGDPAAPASRRAGLRLKGAFAPADRRWRERTVAQALDLIRSAAGAVDAGTRSPSG